MTAPMTVPVPLAHKPTGPGKAEIKRHNDQGILRGLRQLRTGPVTRSRQGFVQGGIGSGQDRYLITYEPVPLGSKTPTHVEVRAVKFPRNTPVPSSLRAVRAMRWISLGQVPAPQVPQTTPQWDVVFGQHVEEPVRNRFVAWVVNPRTGAFKGRAHDVVWDELAEFYSELARELGSMGGSFRF